MKIYNPNNTLALDVEVDDSSYRLREIMGDNRLELRFSHPSFIQINEGAYCEFMNERYWMPRALDYDKEHTQKFTYILNLEGSTWMLKATKFKFFDYTNQGSTVKPTSSFKLKFPITATPRMVADLIIANLKLKYPQYPWAVGDCIESDPVTLDFNHDFCFDVLAKTVDGFQTEWELDKYTLHFRRVERLDNNGNKIKFALSYGYDNGILPGLRRVQYDNTKIINRVYIEGGDRNIDLSTYKNDTLLLPKNKRITYEGIDYKTDASGSYLERVTPLAGEEDSLDVSKFYPKRVGTVSAVEKIDDKQGFYNIIDASIPSDLDYYKQKIAGETMTVIFQTGQLAGKEFDAKYNHTARRFELVPINQNGLIYPQGSIIPAVGDKYAVFHMRMPDSYITEAENEALGEVVKYLWKGEQAQYSYRWTLDGIYARRNWGEIRGFLNIGYFVEFSDPQFLPVPVYVRIVAVKELINDPQSPEITIANNVTSKTMGAVINQIPTVEQAVDRKDSEVKEYAKRRWRAAQDTIDMLQESLLNFSEGINPITVQTMALLIGDESLQFRFVDRKTDPITPVAYTIAYNKATKKLSCPAGILQHMTLGINNISSTHAASEYRFWNMSAYSSAVLTDATKSYYLYAKCSKTTAAGVYLISNTPIAMEGVSGYYHFLTGILNKEYDADRSYVDLYGFTEILPGRITTDKIVSSDGTSFLDLVTNMLQLGNKFLYSPDKLEITGADIKQKDNNGNVVTEIKTDGTASFGKGAHTFKPDGSLNLANGNILYDLISGLSVSGRIESNKDGNRIVIDPVDRSFKMFNAAGNEICIINFTTETYGNKEFIAPKITLNHWVDNQKVSWAELTGYEIRISDMYYNQGYLRADAVGFLNQDDSSVGFGAYRDGAFHKLRMAIMGLPGSRNETLVPNEAYFDGETVKVRRN